jgi:hypothetical protein
MMNVNLENISSESFSWPFFYVMVALLLGDQIVELPGIADQFSYHTLAMRVLNGSFSFERCGGPTNAGAPTAHWIFLYTFTWRWYMPFWSSSPGCVNQGIAIGILQPILTYLITERFLDRI